MQAQQSADGFRSLPHKRPFFEAALLASIQYFTLVAATTLGVILIRAQGGKLTAGFITAVALLALSWLVGLFKRRAAKCPLCKGTPLLDSVAVKHRDSRRLLPLNYGTTALLSLLLTHRFHCMYCGTGFDILRKPSGMR